MSKNTDLILMGLPGTGKTTFLAALWYLIDAPNLETQQTLHKLDGDREYLNDIRDKWLACQHQGRTRPVDERKLSLLLEDTSSSEITNLGIPELSGETYMTQWEKRYWSNPFLQQIGTATGALFFVHPDELKPDEQITEADALVEAIEPSDDSNDEKVDDISKHKPWNPREAPAQVISVELLQFINEHPSVDKPFKLAILVSAWDLVKSLGMSPTEWISHQMPLLHQFLTTNVDIFPHKIYGVSAQGGRLVEDKDKLNKFFSAHERIELIDEDIKSYDLTLSIQWLMK